MYQIQKSSFFVLFVLSIGFAVPVAAQQSVRYRSIFDIPAMRSQHGRLKLEMQQAFAARDYATSALKCQQAIELFPEDPSNHYVLACCQAQMNNTKEAFRSLEAAVENGFNDAAGIEQNGFLLPLKTMDGFPELVKRAAVAQPKPISLFNRPARPNSFRDGIASVEESNTVFRPNLNAFESFFQLQPSARLEGQPATNQNDKVGAQVQQWYFRGLGAGLKNHLYDNHDGGHSELRDVFPQLNRIEYCEAVKQRQFDHGLQTRFFFNAITIGNCSEAMTGNAYWRSLPRLAATSPQAMATLHQQYQRNHLYVYPEHQDHDPTHGDLFASNLPYVLISQGSSGSDQKLLEAVGWTLASFQPKTKRKLAEGGALMAAVQMIFRRTNKQVMTFEDYLTGKAHPTVFNGDEIDLWRMINLAQEIKPEKVPPVVQLRVVEEDQSTLGVDYFDDQSRVKLFDTPGAISRLHRSTKKHYRMVVSAEESFDLNKRPLTIHWRVLRGDFKNIQINPLNAENTRVEIVVPHQESRPIEGSADMVSSRIDIGAFAHNGTYYSAPAFVSFYSPRNESRVYNDHNEIDSVEYLAFETQYEDPMLVTPRQWIDRYQYDEKNRLTGWVRERGDTLEQFTADGALVTKNDEQGRPAQARTVVYRRRQDSRTTPVLEQEMGAETLFYEYDSPQDRVGRIVKRVPAEPSDPNSIFQ